MAVLALASCGARPSGIGRTEEGDKAEKWEKGRKDESDWHNKGLVGGSWRAPPTPD